MFEKSVTKLTFNLCRIYDKFHTIWEDKKFLKSTGTIVVFSFLLILFLVELKRWNLLPSFLNNLVPANHFFAIEFAFTFLLIIEIMSMIFVLSHSVSTSLAKQFEIFSLILLRQAFKDFGEFTEPFIWDENIHQVIKMLADTFGALIIFSAVVFFKQMQKHINITKSDTDQLGFVRIKKVLSLFMIVIFSLAGIYSLISNLFFDMHIHFFKSFYTSLIFIDILIILISLRYNYLYIIVFRNSGFALATVILRLALTAPAYYNIGLGVFASLFIIGLSFMYNKFIKLRLKDTNN